MAYKKKSWKQKLHSGRAPVVEKADKDFAGVRAGEMMLIPTPLLVDEYIRNIPEGREVSVDIMRRDLAAMHHAGVTCPLTTGIFLRIVAEAAHEELEKGKDLSGITPFWRILTPRSPAAKKLSFGTTLLTEMRKKEGLSIS